MPNRSSITSALLAMGLTLSQAALIAFLAPEPVRAQERLAAFSFQSLLEDAGIVAGELQFFDNWDGSLDGPQAALAAKLIHRLELASKLQGFTESAELMSSRPKAEPGSLVALTGRARSIARVGIPELTRAALDQNEFYLCSITLADGSGVDVLSRRAPAAWLKRSPQLFNEPVSAWGVLVGNHSDDRRDRPLFIASRLQWRPQSNVSAGVAWLVDRGFDAALLDEVRHGRAFAKSYESLEGLAFYQCLAIVADSRPDELIQLVRKALPMKAEAAEADLADAIAKRESLAAEWNDATPTRRIELRKQLDLVRRRQAIASGIVERAQRRVSSVAPLFLQPQQNAGDAVLIEGTARRAIRIIEDEDARRAAQSASAQAGTDSSSKPLSEYYELDVFTTDSQNLPVICCVARLPEGFPTGEAIREPVRVAGIFLKQWAYVRRADNDATSARNRPPERLHPPLVLAAAPQWLRVQEPSGPQYRGLWGGLALLAAFIAAWIAIARVSRRDRLAQLQRARYDSSLESIVEP